jgi:hypothetical protein
MPPRSPVTRALAIPPVLPGKAFWMRAVIFWRSVSTAVSRRAPKPGGAVAGTGWARP